MLCVNMILITFEPCWHANDNDDDKLTNNANTQTLFGVSVRLSSIVIVSNIYTLKLAIFWHVLGISLVSVGLLSVVHCWHQQRVPLLAIPISMCLLRSLVGGKANRHSHGVPIICEDLGSLHRLADISFMRHIHIY